MKQVRETTIDGCTLVFGPVDIQKYTADGRVFAPDLASAAGATLVFGPPGAIDALRANGIPGDIGPSTTERADEGMAGMRYEVGLWLQHGDRSPAADTLCSTLFGQPDISEPSDPAGPEDVARCFQMIKSIYPMPVGYQLLYASEMEPMCELSPLWSGVYGKFNAFYRMDAWSEMDEVDKRWAQRIFDQAKDIASLAERNQKFLREHGGRRPFEVAEDWLIEEGYLDSDGEPIRRNQDDLPASRPGGSES